MVTVTILILDVGGVGRGVVRDEQKVEDDESDVQDQQCPSELGLGKELM